MMQKCYGHACWAGFALREMTAQMVACTCLDGVCLCGLVQWSYVEYLFRMSLWLILPLIVSEMTPLENVSSHDVK